MTVSKEGMMSTSIEGALAPHQVILGKRKVVWGNVKEIVIGGKPYLSKRERLLHSRDIGERNPYLIGRGSGYLPFSIRHSGVSESFLPLRPMGVTL